MTSRRRAVVVVFASINAVLENFAGLFELDDGSFGQQLLADLQTIVDGLRALHVFQQRLDGKTTSFGPALRHALCACVRASK